MCYLLPFWLISRPKKASSTVNSTKIVNVDEDPCLNSIVTESILPLIPDRVASNSSFMGGPGKEIGAPSNDNSTPSGEDNALKVRLISNHNTSTGNSSRNTIKGVEGTQVGDFFLHCNNHIHHIIIIYIHTAESDICNK